MFRCFSLTKNYFRFLRSSKNISLSEFSTIIEDTPFSFSVNYQPKDKILVNAPSITSTPKSIYELLGIEAIPLDDLIQGYISVRSINPKNVNSNERLVLCNLPGNISAVEITNAFRILSPIRILYITNPNWQISSCSFALQDSSLTPTVIDAYVTIRNQRCRVLSVERAREEGICLLCGKKGHTQHNCPKGALQCFNCGRYGHTAKNCPFEYINYGIIAFRHGKTICFRCHQYGHLAKDCPNIDNSIPFCHYCYEEGHFPNDCPHRKHTS